MLKINCPYCGTRNHDEFTYVGQARLSMPAFDAPLEAHQAHVYLRKNPRGRHWETWQHTNSCRSFVDVERDTATHEIFACEVAMGAQSHE